MQSLFLAALAVALVAFCSWHVLAVLNQVGAARVLMVHKLGEMRWRRKGEVAHEEWRKRVQAARIEAQRRLEAARAHEYRRVFTTPAGAARRAGHALIFVAFALLGVALLWMSPVLLAWNWRLPTPGWAMLGLFAWTALPALLFVTYAIDKAFESPRASSGARMMWIATALSLSLLLVMAVLAWREANTSPMVPMLCLAAAAYACVRWHLDRLSQQGGGYRRLLGLDAGPERTRPLCLLLKAERFATLADRPFAGLFHHLGPRAWLTGAVAILAAVWVVVWPMHALVGPAFTWLYRLGSGLILFALLGALVYTTVLWKEARLVLRRLARSPLSGSFRQAATLGLDWRPRPSLPRREELAMLMAAADEIDPSGAGYSRWLEEDATEDRFPLLHSLAFFGVWQHLEQYLPGLARSADDAPDAWARKVKATVAVLLAFMVRDLLRRVVSGFTAVTLGLTLLLAAHLLYDFPGRAGALIVDGAAIALTCVLAVRALVQMERDAILSRLWNGTANRLILNRDFVMRMVVYALPSLILVGLLMPEVGHKVCLWLSQARQLAGL